MSRDERAPVIPRKVRPYPIAATLTIDARFKPISIAMINPVGVIAHVPDLLLKVGQRFELTVELPVLAAWIRHTVIVVRTYDRARASGGADRMAEFHFDRLDPDYLREIQRFNQAIGQKT